LTISRLIVSALAFGVSISCPAQTTTIEKLAPENTVFIIGAKGVNASIERMKRTGLWELWENEKMKAMWTELIEAVQEDLAEGFKELGVDKDTLTAPTGAVGLAVFPVPDPDLGITLPGALVLADYGENADKTSQLIAALIEKGETEGDIEVEEKEVLGRTVHVISEIADEDAGDVEVEEDADDMEMDFEFEEGPDPMEQAFKTMHYVREGNLFIASTNLDTLTHALETIDGKGEKDITDRQEYQALLDKIGEHELYAMLLTRDVGLMGAPEQQMNMQMMVPMIRAAVGHVKGYGLGMRLDGPTAMVEQTLAVYMPDGKAGLTTLIDIPAPRGAVPAFVSPDTVTFLSFNFKFSDLMDTINKIAASNPMLQGLMAEQLAMMDAPVRQVTAALGHQVFIANAVTKPLSEDSSHGVFAVQCTNPQEFETLLAANVAQMGIEARDFLGQRIYTMPAEAMAMMPMPGGGGGEAVSLGIGGGYIVLGGTSAVEGALRATSQTGALTLEADSGFKRAVAAIGGDPVIAWGYSDTINQVEAQIYAQRMQLNQMVEDMREFAPEAAQQMQAEYDKIFKFIDDLDFDLLQKHIGPSVWRVRSIDDGFVMNSYTLSAAPSAGN
jgi:hypothetical protein